MALSAVAGFALPSDEIKTGDGGGVRIVWCQDAGDGSDTGAAGNSLRLMGFDTDDGRGERRILPELSNYSRPLLTPDGKKVIYSNRGEDKIYVVGFDGSGLKPLAFGVALAAWRDSLTETDWVYAGTPTNQPDPVIVNVCRFRLDRPEVSEPVWSITPIHGDNFQLSANGRRASGLFPWPSCGVAVLPNREWIKYGDGCWPSLSPDNELLLWIFDGAHRNLAMFRANPQERWVVNINSVPGIDGFEVYHPRWSNNPLFMVMTGPYKIGTGANRIRGGGKDVEIYLGKFSPDFRTIERWIRITRNEYADFYPDAWLAVRPTVGLSKDPGVDDKTVESKWPISYEGLVFFWQNRSKANTFTDPADQVSYACRAEAKGRARFGRHFEMMPSGGAFLAAGGAGELLNKCALSGQLGIEALITPANSSGTNNLLPIIGYAASTGQWNFLLGQKCGELVFRLRSGKGGRDYLIPFGALTSNGPNHVVVSCSSASMACYLNGEQVFSGDSIFGGNWEKGVIVFGNVLFPEYPVNSGSMETAWNGLIENVAIYSRWIGPGEVRKKYAASAANIRNRKQIPLLCAKVKTISTPVIPSPESIAPYRRALAASHYRVEESAEETCASGEIMAAQWIILDARILDSAGRRQGEIFNLRLEPFSDHPELEGERLIMDGDRYDLPLYFDVDN